jgi:hypothetical protein
MAVTTHGLHSFSQVRIDAPILQRKLVIGAVDDPLEREADAVAERVVQMPETSEVCSRTAASTVGGKIQRECSQCEEEDALQRKQTNLSVHKTTAPAIVNEVLRSPGKPLDMKTLGFMEQRFGHDFSRVRVHTDAHAAKSARAVGAHAYTVGSNLVFGQDEFAPSTSRGERLIAHELAHVIQQTDGNRPVGRMLVQRETDEGAAPANGGASSVSASSSQVKDYSRLKPGIEMDVADGRAFATAAIAKMSAHGAKVSAPPSDAIASVEGIGGGSAGPVAASDSETAAAEQLQTSALEPTVQRAGGGTVKPEAGFVGSIQLCYDACNSELSVVGWIWAGGGVVTRGLFGGPSWWGAYVFAEKEFLKTKLGFMPTLNCGTCATDCKREEGGPNWGGGIAGFPIALKPGERTSLKRAGIEVGVLVTPRSSCDADLEMIALLDLTKYLGPIGAAVVSAEELANALGKKFGIEIECGIGVDVSGSVHLCKSVPGGGLLGITADSAKICGGGYVGCGIGLAHDKSALPGI